MTNRTAIELLPCPFCGGEAEVRKLDLDAIDEGWQIYGVWCTDDLHAEERGGYQHGHYIDNYASEAEAIAAWNTRAGRTRECEIKTTENWLPAERYHRCKHCGAFFAVMNASGDIQPCVCTSYRIEHDIYQDYVERIARKIEADGEEALALALKEYGFEKVVRCKDCKHYADHEWITSPQYGLGSDFEHVCHFWHGKPTKVSSDGFCAWGELRGDAE